MRDPLLIVGLPTLFVAYLAVVAVGWRWPGSRLLRRRANPRITAVDLLMVFLLLFVIQATTAQIVLALWPVPAELGNHNVRDWDDWRDALRDRTYATALARPDPDKSTVDTDPVDDLCRRLPESVRQSIGDPARSWNAEQREQLLAAVNAVLARPDETASQPEHDPQTKSDDQLLRQRVDALIAAMPEALSDRIPNTRIFPIHALGSIAAATGILLYLWLACRINLRRIGLRRKHWLSDLGFGLTQAITWWPIAMGINLATRFWIDPAREHPAQQFFLETHSAALWGIFVFSLVIAAPITEELTYRGVLQSWLSGRLGKGWGLGIASALFALAHAQTWPDPVPLFFVGLGLGLTYQRSRSLWGPIGFHAAFNASNLPLGLWGT